MQRVIDSQVGPLLIEASEQGLQRIEFTRDKPRVIPSPSTSLRMNSARNLAQHDSAASLVAEVQTQLSEYFSGRRRAFDLPLDLTGSDFQRRVWRAIAAIPFGETVSYAALAAAAGAPGAYRAAGAACGANPVAIVVPCHRVVGSDGRLHGFGGGLETKALLLQHEASLRFAHV